MYHPQTLNCLTSDSTHATKENGEDAKAEDEGASEYDELAEEEKM